MNSSTRALPSLTILLALSISTAACGPSGANGTPAGAPSNSETRLPAAQDVSGNDTDQRRPEAGLAWVIFGADTLTVEVARTADQRSQGLMDREELAEDSGMLFVFESAEERSFWMSNTAIPLDIAYMDPQFRIFTIKPMEPMSEELVDSDGPAQYALEVNRGWFEEHGVRVGAQPEVVFGM